MFKEDWVDVDLVVESLANQDIKENICQHIADRAYEDSIFSRRNKGEQENHTSFIKECCKDYVKNNYIGAISRLRYFDLSDNRYRTIIRGVVLLFLIVELLIINLCLEGGIKDLQLIRCFYTFTLVFLCCLVVYYTWLWIIAWNETLLTKKRCYKRMVNWLITYDIVIMAISIFLLHFFLVVFSGGITSPFWGGLLFLSGTILGLPRDGQKKLKSGPNFTSIFIILGVMLFYLAHFLSKGTLEMQLMSFWGKFNFSDLPQSLYHWLSFSIFIIGTSLALLLRLFGAKSINLNQ